MKICIDVIKDTIFIICFTLEFTSYEYAVYLCSLVYLNYLKKNGNWNKAITTRKLNK